LPIDGKVQDEMVRFRTLGCYPLTGAIESDSVNLDQIIYELQKSKFSERQGRLIDNDQVGSMEKKKQQGYF
jgi:sulfate adenylyltransferase subunit 2